MKLMTHDMSRLKWATDDWCHHSSRQ